MIVYKYFLKTALKNKGIILTYMTIFFVLSILSSLGIDQKENRFLESKLNIGIIDNSNSELSSSLIHYLGEKNDIMDIGEDVAEIKEQIFLEMLDAVLIIPEDFVDKTIDKKASIDLYKDDRKIESMQIQNQINKFLLFANAAYKEGGFDLESVNKALGETIDVEVIEGKTLKNTSIQEWFRSYYNFISYAIVGMYIGVIGLVMADFNEQNIFNRVRVSSKQLLSFNTEVYLGQLTIAAVTSFVFIAGSIILKGRYIGEIDFTRYLINTVVFSFTILCLTFLINNLTRNKFVINGISVVFSLGSSFISGVMVPQELLGEKTLMIARFLPNYYFVRINDMKTGSILDMKFDIGIQILFAIVFLLMGVHFSRMEQKA